MIVFLIEKQSSHKRMLHASRCDGTKHPRSHYVLCPSHFFVIPASDWPTAKVYPGYISILTNHNSKPCMQFTQLHKILACDWPRGPDPLVLTSYDSPIKPIKGVSRFCPRCNMAICKFVQSSQIDAAKLLQMSRYTFEQLLATPPNTPTVVGPFTPGALDAIAAVPAAEDWDVTDF